MADDWNPLHPDWLAGPDLDIALALFGDIDWQDRSAVEERVNDLKSLTPKKS